MSNATGAPRFYCASGPRQESIGAVWTLPDDVAHHAVRVRRLEVGDALTLFDATGGEFAATLVATGKRVSSVRLDEFVAVERESPLQSLLVQALAANDAMDYAIRKAVEAGVTAIQPVDTARSARMPDGERGAKRLTHWRQIAVAACEQCGRNRVPEVRPVRELAQWLGQRPTSALGLVFVPQRGISLQAIAPPVDEVELLIGPEGGLADEEIDRAVAAGLLPMRIGPRTLRTETAAIAALAILQNRFGDWQ